jgi:hypothetical protein
MARSAQMLEMYQSSAHKGRKARQTLAGARFTRDIVRATTPKQAEKAKEKYRIRLERADGIFRRERDAQLKRLNKEIAKTVPRAPSRTIAETVQDMLERKAASTAIKAGA